jgi:hypothetical protein
VSRRPSGEEGQLTLLVIGFTIIAATMIAVAIDASVVFLARQRLASQADGAALAAAQQMDDGAYFGSASCIESLPVAQGAVDAAISPYVKQGVELAAQPVPVDGGPGVVVRGRSVVTLPIVGKFGRRTFTVEYDARARSSIAGVDC